MAFARELVPPGPGTSGQVSDPVPAARPGSAAGSGPVRGSLAGEVVLARADASRVLDGTQSPSPAASQAHTRAGTTDGDVPDSRGRQRGVPPAWAQVTFNKRPTPERGPAERNGDPDPVSGPGALLMAAATPEGGQEPPREGEPGTTEGQPTTRPPVDFDHTANQLRYSARVLADQARKLTAYSRSIPRLVTPNPQSDPNPLAASVREKTTSALLVESRSPKSARWMLIEAGSDLGELAFSTLSAVHYMVEDVNALAKKARDLETYVWEGKSTLELMEKGVPTEPLVPRLPEGKESVYVRSVGKSIQWEARSADEVTRFYAERLAPRLGRHMGAVRDAVEAVDRTADDPYSAEAKAAMSDAATRLEELKTYIGSVADNLWSNHARPLRDMSIGAWNIAAHYRHVLDDPHAPALIQVETPFPPESAGTPWGQPAPQPQPGTLEEQPGTPEGQPQEQQTPEEGQQSPPGEQEGSLDAVPDAAGADTQRAGLGAEQPAPVTGAGEVERQAPVTLDASLDRTPLEQAAFDAPVPDASGSDSGSASSLSNSVQVASGGEAGSGDTDAATPSDGSDLASLDASLELGDMSLDAATV